MDPCPQDEPIDDVNVPATIMVPPEHVGDFGGPEIADSEQALGTTAASDDYLNSGETEIQHLATDFMHNPEEYSEYYTS